MPPAPYALRSSISAILLLGLLPGLAGCVNNTTPANPPQGSSATKAPSILKQPSSFTVPIGLQGTLSVAVTGDGSLTEQLFRDGVAIPGANSLTYTTPTFAAADSGTVYTFAISNSLGSATSQPATLTAGARAPKDGDLRFQQDDSRNTINGYGTGTGLPTDLVDRGGYLSPNAFGILYLDYEECPSGGAGPIGCVYFLSAFAQPPGAVPLAAGFYGNFYDNFESDLSSGYFPASNFGGGSLLSPNTVVTSLSISTEDDRYVLSWLQTSQTGGFDLAQHRVNPSQFQTAAMQEGQTSRVITAVSFAAGQLVYFSYGWQSDTSTVYETQVATATFTNVGAVALTLATQGYIITALGGDAIDGLVLVGTRVQGDTLPRPILVEPFDHGYLIPPQGYAIVGTIGNLVNNPATGVSIGER